MIYFLFLLARNITAKKITAIVEKEFSLEIDLKEKEILKIQEQLHKTLKIFHLLRYVIINDFYNREQCQVSQTTETTKQTRIHPAVKSLLGKCPKSIYKDFAVPSTSKDPRFLCNDKSFVSDTKITSDNILKIKEDAYEQNKTLQGKKRTLEDQKEPQLRKVPRYMPPKSNILEDTCPLRGSNHKVRKRIIVGNISKWIPPDWREDASSHKWTMYVRGDKNNADISEFVSKVRFLLHPSYRPNDVVEITTYPFHLSRRGWGEFPVRVQLHFKNVLNKPMDIIHHLKLDRTYTGLQTLGSETLVDVWINITESRNLEQNSDNKSTESSINDVSIKMESSDTFEYKQEKSKATSQLTACTFEEIRVKQEIIDNSEICEQANSIYSTKKSEDVKVKVEYNNVITETENVDRLTLQKMRHYIKLDHDYYNKQYSHNYIEREGNITIEHFAENNDLVINSSVINSSLINNNEKKKSDDVTIVLHKFNGSIKPSDGMQITDSIIFDNSQVVKSEENIMFQESNNQNNPILFDTMTSEMKYLQNNNNSRILENISAKDASTTINGFCKSLDSISFDQLNHIERIRDSSKCNTQLEPLQVTIPSSTVTFSKHVLVLNDKKSIPVDVTNIFPSKSKLIDGNAKFPIAKDSNVAKVNVRIPQGISILKKPYNIKTNVQQKITANNNKRFTTLKLNSANSVLLNVNENVPILKILDGNDLSYNYSHINATKYLSSESNIHKQKSCTKLEKSTMQRARVTLGKDKHKIQSKRDLYEMILRSIDTANITDTKALVRYIIRRLPIITSDANDSEYRQLHPYACRSEKDFFAYNIGKQRALEWNRAKMIKYFLQRKSIPVDKLWSIKEIIVWARLHGYTPILNMPKAILNTIRLSDMSTSTSAVFSTCTYPVALEKWLQSCQQESSQDDNINVEEIDVENIESITCRTTIDRRKNDNIQNSNCPIVSTLIPLELDKNLLPFHNFVCDTARDIGIEIESEEIVPGIQYCAASHVIIRVRIPVFRITCYSFAKPIIKIVLPGHGMFC